MRHAPLLLAFLGFATLTASPAEATPPSPTNWRKPPPPPAQPAPFLNVYVEAREIVRGWPIKLTLTVHPAEQSKPVTLAPASWDNVLSIELRSADGAVMAKAQPLTALTGAVTLDGSKPALATFQLSPAQTQSLPAGTVKVVPIIKIPSAPNGWTGETSGTPETATVVDEGTLTVERKRDKHVALLEYHLRGADYTAAIAEADAWVAEEPNAYYAHAARGEALAAAGKKQEALASLDTAAKLLPPMPDVPPPFLRTRERLFRELRHPTP